MCRVNEYEAVLSLVSYYQMVSRSDDVIEARFALRPHRADIVIVIPGVIVMVIITVIVIIVVVVMVIVTVAVIIRVLVLVIVCSAKGCYAGNVVSSVLRVSDACDLSGAPRVAASAAAEGVRGDVWSGRGAHLHPPELRPDHGAGAGPADGHSG